MSVRKMILNISDSPLKSLLDVSGGNRLMLVNRLLQVFDELNH